MINFDTCLWPSHIGLIKMQAAIKNRLTPNNNWSSMIRSDLYVQYCRYIVIQMFVFVLLKS